MTLKAPFPWFGGKSRVAHLVWERFGNVPNYVEPFFGSGAVLLGRPHEPRTETINDKDAFVANFWRAIKYDPKACAEYADWPVSEADLHARHLWLVTEGKKHVERLKTDPDYFDAKIAGWWVWGICQWIGSGWCLIQQLPHLGDAGRGTHRPSQQLPHLGNAGQGINKPCKKESLYQWFLLLSERLRETRICCGDWARVCTEAVTIRHGITGIFLDPPYPKEADRNETLYAEEDLEVAHAAAEFAIENANDPMLRIIFCGYEGSHTFPDDWKCLAWKAAGGYAMQGNKANENCKRERIWFSPHCLGVSGPVQGELFKAV